MKKQIRNKIISTILVLGMLLSGETLSPASTSDAMTLSTQKPINLEMTEGCMYVGVRGDYVNEDEKALARINEIRWEACKEGVPDPRNPGKNLTEADYVPIKWSSELESVARIRAAEASIAVGHTRPNGKGCFSLYAKEGVDSGEVLAWNISSSMLTGIEQWYGEKSAWLDSNSNITTGHYTSMIDPKNTHVGLGCMITKYGVWKNTTCGRFGSTSQEMDGTMSSALKSWIQKIEIKKTALTENSLEKFSATSTENLKIGDTVSYEFTVGTNIDGDQAKVQVVDSVRWTSSNMAVATVDGVGNVTGVGAGTAEITASSISGMTASVTLTFKDVDTGVSKPAKVKSVKAKAGVGKLTVTWKKIKDVSGYQVQYAQNKKFIKNKKSKATSKNKIVLKKLRKKKTYFIRVRAYKQNGTKKIYGKWSNVVKGKVKK